MGHKNYYELLGITKDASSADIKKSYRRLARKYHPDVSKESNAEEKFKEIKAAYEVLKDEKKRKDYDEFGENWEHAAQYREQPQPQWHQQYSGNYNNYSDDDLSDLFAEVLREKGQKRSQGQQFKFKGQDQHSRISVSLHDAYFGTECSLQLQMPEMTNDGHVSLQTKVLKIKIPAGVTDGKQIRLKGQGGAGIGGGENGDIYLEVNIGKDKNYILDGKDISLTIPVSPWEAALGASIEVPTLSGIVKMKVPTGSQTGSKLRLKGKGMPSKIPGDFYVILKVIIPEPKSDDQKEVYEKMKQSMPFDPREQLMEEVK